MSVDRRAKGCSNPECPFHKEKIKQKADLAFCPKCGYPLVFVCQKCFSEIEDIDSKHKICSLCEAKKDEKKEKTKENVKKAGLWVGGIVGPAALGVLGGALKKGTTEIVNKGIDAAGKAVGAAAKIVFKK